MLNENDILRAKIITEVCLAELENATNELKGFLKLQIKTEHEFFLYGCANGKRLMLINLLYKYDVSGYTISYDEKGNSEVISNLSEILKKYEV